MKKYLLLTPLLFPAISFAAPVADVQNFLVSSCDSVSTDSLGADYCSTWSYTLSSDFVQSFFQNFLDTSIKLIGLFLVLWLVKLFYFQILKLWG